MSVLDNIKHVIGDLARPVSIIATSIGASWASVVTAYRVDSGTDGALLIAAIYAGLGALYWGKAWEIVRGRGEQNGG